MRNRTAILATALVLAASLVLGCTSGHRTEEGAAIGAGVGAAGGGIAALAGASPWWILGGAAIGAVGGAIAGDAIDAHDEHCHADHYRCSHCDTVYCNSPDGCPHCGSRDAVIYHP